ncbi:hypothetical protein DW993_00765 [Clostridium sp. AM51-4]|nr:hypothetical protein DW993_00765 [Clostridium sp. AM51-4]
MIRYFFRFKRLCKNTDQKHQPEYFLERCRINGIFFWELVCLKKGEYQCSLFLKDFYRLRGCARGKGVRLRICERRGLPFFFRETGNDGMRQQVFPVFSFCSILCLCSYGISIFRAITIILQIRWCAIWIHRMCAMG